MTLAEILAEVLAEHRWYPALRQCHCRWQYDGLGTSFRAHQAEMLVERLGIEAQPNAVLCDDGSIVKVEPRDYVFPDDVGLFRVRALESLSDRTEDFAEGSVSGSEE